VRRIGFYGGSFNPPHLGHQSAILHALECADVEHILIAPVFKHPDGKGLAPYEDRLHMLQLLVEPLPQARVVVSTYEKIAYEALNTGYTIDTIRTILADCPFETKIVLIMGSDLKPAYPKWAGHADIEALVAQGKVEIFWVERHAGTSSTLVRMSIKHGWSTRRLLPKRLSDFIKEKCLYKCPRC
jgi:nicotinate (nicotinamide) nucleotide adenylyltransferase